MQGKSLLHKFINESCVGMHKKIKISLQTTCEALFSCKQLSVTAMGRAVKSKTAPKHRIKRVDHLISNDNILAYKDCIYQNFINNIMPNGHFLPVVIDTCFLTPDTEFQVLRGSLALGGRALTIYEIVYKNGELSKTMQVFLKRLKKILPLSRRVVLITDAGFHNRWFKLVMKQGWDFIGRIRQNKSFTPIGGEKKYVNSLHQEATTTAKYHGEVKLCSENKVLCHLYTVKKKLQGRKKKNSKGTIDNRGDSKLYSRSQREPWVLASSLSINQFNAKQIVALYGLRMQIEESFRDIKNSRYGFGFKRTLTRNKKRLNALLLIAAIVTFIAWIIGKVAENKHWHRGYQSNTIKRRTLSYFYLGLMVMSSSLRVTSIDVKQGLQEIRNNYIATLLDLKF